MTDEELIARLRHGGRIVQGNYAAFAADRIEELVKERDRQYDENVHRIAEQAKAEAQADYEAALSEVARLSHALAAETAKREAMEEAINGMMKILNRNNTKGPISDVELMFCWLADRIARVSMDLGIPSTTSIDSIATAEADAEARKLGV